MTNKDEAAERRLQSTSTLEWVTAAIGAGIVISMIAYLVFYAFTQPSGPPVITLTSGTVEQTSGGYRMPFTASNEGHSTAAALQLRATLLSGSDVVEESRLTIDYVPENSHRSGGFFFTRDPRQHTVRLLAEGYSDP